MTTLFADHTLESAPPAARRSMESTVRHLGHLSPAVARMATSPQTLEAFLRSSALFETTSLPPVAREVLIMTIATGNDCHVCIEMHAARLAALGTAPELVVALRERVALDDPALEAVRVFTLAVLGSAGKVTDQEMRAFLDAGYTPQNALEIVLGIGVYTLSTFANRMTGASLV